MQSKYGSNSSSSKSNLSTYTSIINNRYADYDDFTKKYTIDNMGKVEAWDYITNEYVSGRLNDNDYAYLVAMYGLSEPTDEDRLNLERQKYLESISY